MSPPSWHHHTCRSPTVHAERMEVDVPDTLSFFTHLVLFQPPVTSVFLSLRPELAHLLSPKPCSDLVPVTAPCRTCTRWASPHARRPGCISCQRCSPPCCILGGGSGQSLCSTGLRGTVWGGGEELNRNPRSVHLYHAHWCLCAQTVNTWSVASPVLSHTDTGLGLGCMDPVHLYL